MAEFDQDTGRHIAARHAEVLGRPPRIAPVDRASAAEEVEASTRRLLVGIGAPADMAMPPIEAIPEIMFTLCRFPALWQGVMDLTIPLQGPVSVLPPRDRKLAILRTGWLCAAPYEFGEHVVQARRLGFTAAQIEAIVTGPDAAVWDEHERAILRAVDELHGNAMIGDETWERLAERLDEAQLFELLVLVGQFTATAYFQNSLRLRLEAGNAGLAAR
ncbi:MAG TPA: carboxymuconolactone decarboxylase family protein [Novosphingobium sp.]|nr:carboxymuconolactone decarboxylase family protein [Novosphingobium sp.]